MESNSVSKCGSRISAAHIRFKQLQELHGLRAVPFQNVALALAQRTFVETFARVSRVSMIDLPRMVFGGNSSLRGCNSYVASQC
eukprot:4545237-Pyramimonas_sp.AAC.1